MINEFIFAQPIGSIFFANGELAERDIIAKHVPAPIIAVDGGFNHCHRLSLMPAHFIGDMDSVNKRWLEEKRYDNLPRTLLEKEKDQSDLEVAINKWHVKGSASLLYGGFSSERPDHFFYHLFLLHRYPGELFLIVGDEILFSLKEGGKPLEIEALFSIFINAYAFYKDTEVDINQSAFSLTSFAASCKERQKKLKLSSTRGTPLILLSQKEGGPLHRFLDEMGRLITLKAQDQPYYFKGKKGATLSFFPHFQEAAIVTHGLKWELEETAPLTPYFLSLSNICQKDDFSITVLKGSILPFFSP